jgi:beta-lactamase superfamily II metal-dependent hydrolase
VNGRYTLLAAVTACLTVCGLAACSTSEGAWARPAQSQRDHQPASELVVRVLDVGQGDATLIENGGSRVLIDGGPDEKRMEVLLDSLHLDDSTFDVVILTHQHADHLIGLRSSAAGTSAFGSSSRIRTHTRRPICATCVTRWVRESTAVS